ncbi:MAG: HypC/HybG/HupF family hydrogenase formation chaperone [Candidatus Diapherotrites archaeon]|nr:HypC/HybG/HupF family hydrogenase formation chaperone [Candidatus Diapherotrites archaeon]
MVMKCKRRLRLKFKFEDKELFLAYAMACVDNVVKAGKIKADEADELLRRFVADDDISEEEIEKLWPIAIRNLTNMAIDEGSFKDYNTIITNDIIHKYFWDEHYAVVLTHPSKEKQLLCFVLPAKILSINGNEANVNTKFGERIVKLDFIDNPKIGDLVTVHWYYACEKITEEQAELLRRRLE